MAGLGGRSTAGRVAFWLSKYSWARDALANRFWNDSRSSVKWVLMPVAQYFRSCSPVGGFEISRFCACPEREVKIVQATQFDFSPELVSIGSRGKGSTILIRLGQQRRSQAAMPSSIQRLNSATLSFGQGSSQGMLPSSRVA